MNPMIQNLLQAAMNGGDTMGLVKNFLDSQDQNDPRVAQARRMIFGKSAGELEQTGRNLMKEAGTTPADLLASFGISLPNGR